MNRYMALGSQNGLSTSWFQLNQRFCDFLFVTLFNLPIFKLVNRRIIGFDDSSHD